MEEIEASAIIKFDQSWFYDKCSFEYIGQLFSSAKIIRERVSVQLTQYVKC